MKTFINVPVVPGINAHYIYMSPGEYVVGVDTPTTAGIIMTDSTYNLRVATGTTNCYQWQKIGAQ